MPDRMMQAAVFEDEGRLLVREVSVPAISSPQDVLIRVEACGVCGTDIRILAVPPIAQAQKGIILGHEYIGHVVDVGHDVAHRKVVDAVGSQLTAAMLAARKGGRIIVFGEDHTA